MKTPQWTDTDLQQMRSLGVDPAEASRQLGIFRAPPPFTRLDRPAVLGDGILRLEKDLVRGSLDMYETSRKSGRFMKFVPASGAASRMFQVPIQFSKRSSLSWNELRAEAAEGHEESRQMLSLMGSLHHAAFWDDLQEAIAREGGDLAALLGEGKFREILEVLLSARGLHYSERPKGLIKFHAHSLGARTAVEEHLIEAIHYVQDAGKNCRIHFTVSPEHEAEFRRHLDDVVPRYEGLYAIRLEVGLSSQSRSTNTLAADERNEPFRQDGLVFRPGGHGALIANLEGSRGDLVYVKNIDNVAAVPFLQPTVHWKKVLGGFLAMTQERIFRCLEELGSEAPRPADLKGVENFVRDDLGSNLGEGFEGLPVRGRIERLCALLDRPVRVCGVVANRGEPGGGPFWVRDRQGSLSLQIVESAQVDPEDPGQQAVFKSSTHFNPVDIVCGLRDRKGDAFGLKRRVDPSAVFITRKSMGGRELRALELPGLWNGGMADWITLFVEVPVETFNPVKTVFDLLKPAHQPSLA